jgi:hypothetical protein
MGTSTKKLDLKKELKQFYQASQDVSEVIVPALQYLMIDGQGDPNTSKEYREAIEALFSLSYAVKFAVKKQGGSDYSVMPLETLWWTEEGRPFLTTDKGSWRWTSMILQPQYVTERLITGVTEEVRKKKALKALPLIRFGKIEEGRSLQIMHVGPYSTEGETISRLHEYGRDRGYTLSGKHHEIYLSAPNRTAAEKLKTILRQPVS